MQIDQKFNNNENETLERILKKANDIISRSKKHLHRTNQLKNLITLEDSSPDSADIVIAGKRGIFEINNKAKTMDIPSQFRGGLDSTAHTQATFQNKMGSNNQNSNQQKSKQINVSKFSPNEPQQQLKKQKSSKSITNIKQINNNNNGKISQKQPLQLKNNFTQNQTSNNNNRLRLKQKAYTLFSDNSSSINSSNDSSNCYKSEDFEKNQQQYQQKQQNRYEDDDVNDENEEFNTQKIKPIHKKQKSSISVTDFMQNRTMKRCASRDKMKLNQGEKQEKSSPPTIKISEAVVLSKKENNNKRNNSSNNQFSQLQQYIQQIEITENNSGVINPRGRSSNNNNERNQKQKQQQQKKKIFSPKPQELPKQEQQLDIVCKTQPDSNTTTISQKQDNVIGKVIEAVVVKKLKEQKKREEEEEEESEELEDFFNNFHSNFKVTFGNQKEEKKKVVGYKAKPSSFTSRNRSKSPVCQKQESFMDQNNNNNFGSQQQQFNVRVKKSLASDFYEVYQSDFMNKKFSFHHKNDERGDRDVFSPLSPLGSDAKRISDNNNYLKQSYSQKNIYTQQFGAKNNNNGFTKSSLQQQFDNKMKSYKDSNSLDKRSPLSNPYMQKKNTKNPKIFTEKNDNGGSAFNMAFKKPPMNSNISCKNIGNQQYLFENQGFSTVTNRNTSNNLKAGNSFHNNFNAYAFGVNSYTQQHQDLLSYNYNRSSYLNSGQFNNRPTSVPRNGGNNNPFGGNANKRLF